MVFDNNFGTRFGLDFRHKSLCDRYGFGAIAKVRFDAICRAVWMFWIIGGSSASRAVFISSNFSPIKFLMSTAFGMSFTHLFAFLPGRSSLMRRVSEMDTSVMIIATLLGGGLALSSHGTKAALRAGANLSPEPVSNWTLSIVEDIIAFCRDNSRGFRACFDRDRFGDFPYFFCLVRPESLSRNHGDFFAESAHFSQAKVFRKVARKAG